MEDGYDVWDDTPEGDRRPARPTPRTEPDVRSSNEYKALRAAFLYRCRTVRNKDGSYGLPCSLCHEAIDYRTHHRSPWAPTVDHVIPVRVRPDLALDVTNWAPAHKHCNQARKRTEEDERRELGVPSEAW